MAKVHIKVLADKLGSTMRRSPATNITIKDGTPVSGIAMLIIAAAKGKKIDRLSLLAHGYTEKWNGGANRFAVETPNMSYSKEGGGYGVQMGVDIDVRNITGFGALKPHLAADAVIDVYACDAADVSPDLPMNRMKGDGEAMLRALAQATGATVRSSKSAHIFANGGTWVDVGRFEGQILQFKPDGRIVPENFSRMEDYD